MISPGNSQIAKKVEAVRLLEAKLKGQIDGKDSSLGEEYTSQNKLSTHSQKTEIINGT